MPFCRVNVDDDTVDDDTVDDDTVDDYTVVKAHINGKGYESTGTVVDDDDEDDDNNNSNTDNDLDDDNDDDDNYRRIVSHHPLHHPSIRPSSITPHLCGMYTKYDEIFEYVSSSVGRDASLVVVVSDIDGIKYAAATLLFGVEQGTDCLHHHHVGIDGIVVPHRLI